MRTAGKEAAWREALEALAALGDQLRAIAPGDPRIDRSRVEWYRLNAALAALGAIERDEDGAS